MKELLVINKDNNVNKDYSNWFVNIENYSLVRFKMCISIRPSLSIDFNSLVRFVLISIFILG